MKRSGNAGKPLEIEARISPVMGGAGLEPATPRTSSVCSTGLS